MAFYEFPGTNYHDLNLDWLLAEMKKCLAEWAAVHTEWENVATDNATFKATIEAEWDELRSFVTNYFENLDVSAEISAKIDEMAADGSLLQVIRATVATSSATAAAAWLAENITQETGYVLDTTLTVAGAAADAKATGDRIGTLQTATAISFNEETTLTLTLTTRTYIKTNGGIDTIDNSAWATSALVDISTYDSLIVTAGSGYNNLVYAFYASDESFISGLNSGSGTMNLSNEPVAIPANAVYIRLAKTATSGTPRLKGVKTTLENSASKRLMWAGKKWVVVGDSLTAVNTRATKRYYDYVSETTGISVVNMGDSGSGYRAEQGSGTAFYQRIVNVPTDADVITIFGSFNDGLSNLGTATDTGTETVGGCVNATLTALFNVYPLAKVGIVSPTPWDSANPYNHTAGNAYANLLEEICKRWSIPFLNLYYESGLRPWEAAFRALAYTHDDGNGVHPDETGHAILAPRFEEFIATIIE